MKALRVWDGRIMAVTIVSARDHECLYFAAEDRALHADEYGMAHIYIYVYVYTYVVSSSEDLEVKLWVTCRSLPL